MKMEDIRAFMSQREFQLLRDLIYKESGLYFADGKRYFLEIHLRPRLKELGLESFEDYYRYLLNRPPGDKEWMRLFDKITIPETFFFRDPRHFEVLKDEVIPEITARKKYGIKRLSLWSAGCATGEEAYTLAMILLEESQVSLKGWSFKVIGSDISMTALQKAKEGAYSEYSVRYVPDLYMKKYFIEVKGIYYVSNDVRRCVDFLRVNLSSDEEMRRMRYFDVIFCRNVLIYFDKKSKEKVLERLYESLNTGGYLFIGSTETLFGIDTPFKGVRFPGCTAYKKEDRDYAS